MQPVANTNRLPLALRASQLVNTNQKSTDSRHKPGTSHKSTSSQQKPTTVLIAPLNTTAPIKASTHPGDSEVVKFLEGIADTRWFRESFRKRRDAYFIPFDAGSITRLVMQASLVAKDPSSQRIKRFVEQYREDEALDMDRIKYSYIEDMIHDYVRRFDELFFFGLLTRKTRKRVQGKDTQRLLVIVIPKKLTRDNDYGSYSDENDEIQICIQYDDYYRYSFGHPVLTITHEMVHAYLTIFSDYRHKHYAV
ncbi:hypothetical protein F5B21DRAFT_528756 [Xylaria acuta]|nr:hypothetical protein F5B21DRAFT_528756 [Xylaria acuta]